MPTDLFALTDLCTPWCVHVAASLRVAQHIEAGASGVEAIAAAAHCDPENLHNVLSHLVSKGVFEEPEPGHFTLNDAARGLLDPALLLGLDLDGIGGRMAHVWGTLLSYVKTGKTAYHEAFGMTFWQDLDAHPPLAASFDQMIGPTGHGSFKNFEITGGWNAVKTVVDVGGGTGAMLHVLLDQHPNLRGTLVDLPRTVARATPHPRLTIHGQSFFDPLPAGQDVYLLRGVINDWPDSEALAILKGCAEAARPGGRVVILKSVCPDNTPPRLTIEMVLAGGKHRTVSQFRPLAQAAGLTIISAANQPAYFVVELKHAAV